MGLVLIVNETDNEDEADTFCEIVCSSLKQLKWFIEMWIDFLKDNIEYKELVINEL